MQQRIAGRYRVEGLLGEGAFGVVYRCIDETLDRAVALKRLHPQWRGGEGEARFLREAALAARVEHPHVVSVFDQGRDQDGAPYLVCALVTGTTLEAEVERAGAARDEATLRRWLGELAGGLEAIHQAGVLHRDLKPANVFLEAGRALLGDFGLARGGAEGEHTVLTATGALVGTPRYLAPEVFLGAEQGREADVWALGATLFEVAYGRAFHSDRDFEELVAWAQEGAPVVPRVHGMGRYPELDRLLCAMLDPSPARRPGAREVARRAEEPAGATSGAAPPTLSAGSARRRPAAWLPAMLLLGVVLGWGIARGPTQAPVTPPVRGTRQPPSEAPRPAPSLPRAESSPGARAAATRAALGALRLGRRTPELPPAHTDEGHREILLRYRAPGTVARWREFLGALAAEGAAGGPTRAEDYLHLVEQLHWMGIEIRNTDGRFANLSTGAFLATGTSVQAVAAWDARREELLEPARELLASLTAEDLRAASNPYLGALLELAFLDPVPAVRQLVEQALDRLAEAPGHWAVVLSRGVRDLIQLRYVSAVLPWAWREEMIRRHLRVGARAVGRLRPPRAARVARDRVGAVVARLMETPWAPPEEFLEAFDQTLEELLAFRGARRGTVDHGLRGFVGEMQAAVLRDPSRRASPAYLARVRRLREVLEPAPSSG